MTTYNWITLLLGSGILLEIFRRLFHQVKSNETKTKAIQTGVQALLRDRLLAEYNKALHKGYAHIYDKENFENMYTQYHNLGGNGVMEQIREEYHTFPTEKEGQDE